jgi:hypothetical protein
MCSHVVLLPVLEVTPAESGGGFLTDSEHTEGVGDLVGSQISSSGSRASTRKSADGPGTPTTVQVVSEDELFSICFWCIGSCPVESGLVGGWPVSKTGVNSWLSWSSWSLDHGWLLWW